MIKSIMYGVRNENEFPNDITLPLMSQTGTNAQQVDQALRPQLGHIKSSLIPVIEQEIVRN